MAFKVDDESLAEEASKVQLTMDGYDKVAAFASNVAMRVFIKRIIETKGWYVSPDESRLGELVWEHSGIRRTQTLAQLIEDLQAAEWVDKDPEAVQSPSPDATEHEPPAADVPPAAAPSPAAK